MAIIVKDETSSKDIEIFNLYFEKQDYVRKSIEMWTKSLTALNLGLFTALAFLLKMGESLNLLELNSISYSLLLAIIPLSTFGLIVCQIWLKAHQNLQEWQIRTNSVLGNVESVLLKNKLITRKQEVENNSMDDNSVWSTCGMWNMINWYEPPDKKRSSKDAMDVIARLPWVFKWTWIMVGGSAIGLIIFKKVILD